MSKTTSLQNRIVRASVASFAVCIAAVALMTGCSSTKPNVDKSPIRAQTFSFMNPGPKPLPTYADESKQAHALVQEAITKNLQAKGIQYVPAGGSVTIAYLIIVGNNVATTSLNEYFGYGGDAGALVNKAHAQQTGGSGPRGYYESGTLVIDVVDPATSKLLQRRSVQAQLLRNLPVETRTARLQTLVDQALKDLPLGK